MIDLTTGGSGGGGGYSETNYALPSDAIYNFDGATLTNGVLDIYNTNYHGFGGVVYPIDIELGADDELVLIIPTTLNMMSSSGDKEIFCLGSGSEADDDSVVLDSYSGYRIGIYTNGAEDTHVSTGGSIPAGLAWLKVIVRQKLVQLLRSNDGINYYLLLVNTPSGTINKLSYLSLAAVDEYYSARSYNFAQSINLAGLSLTLNGVSVRDFVTVVPVTPPTPQKIFVQPILTDEGTLGGDSFAVTQDKYCQEPGANAEKAWRLFNGSLVGDGSNDWNTYKQTEPRKGTATVYNPTPLKIFSVWMLNYNSARNFASVIVSGSNDGTNYTTITSNLSTITGAQQLVVLTNDNFYKYYKFECTVIDSSPCIASVEWYINAVEQ